MDSFNQIKPIAGNENEMSRKEIKNKWIYYILQLVCCNTQDQIIEQQLVSSRTISTYDNQLQQRQKSIKEYKNKMMQSNRQQNVESNTNFFKGKNGILKFQQIKCNYLIEVSSQLISGSIQQGDHLNFLDRDKFEIVLYELPQLTKGIKMNYFKQYKNKDFIIIISNGRGDEQLKSSYDAEISLIYTDKFQFNLNIVDNIIIEPLAHLYDQIKKGPNQKKIKGIYCEILQNTFQTHFLYDSQVIIPNYVDIVDVADVLMSTIASQLKIIPNIGFERMIPSIIGFFDDRGQLRYSIVRFGFNSSRSIRQFMIDNIFYKNYCSIKQEHLTDILSNIKGQIIQKCYEDLQDMNQLNFNNWYGCIIKYFGLDFQIKYQRYSECQILKEIDLSNQSDHIFLPKLQKLKSSQKSPFSLDLSVYSSSSIVMFKYNSDQDDIHSKSQNLIQNQQNSSNLQENNQSLLTKHS